MPKKKERSHWFPQIPGLHDRSNDIYIALRIDSYMLKDQMGLVRLLFEELPEISRQAEAVGNLAFNVSSDKSTLAYSCSSGSTEIDIQH
jgi:hypothetical protein